MRKDVVKSEDISTTQLETLPAIQFTDLDPLEELFGSTAVHEQGLVSISPNKGATSFNSGSYGNGTIDGPLKAVILDLDIRRTLWAFGTQEVVSDIMEWSGKRPICSSSNTWKEDGTVIPGAIHGTVNKELDKSTPELVKNLVIPILESKCKCRPKGFRGTNGYCQWSDYGTAFSGAGQACRESRLLLLYLIDEDLVCTLNINPTSLNNWSDYDITFQNKHWSTVVTEISTEVQKKDNQNWNILRFAPYKENKQVLKTTKDILKPIFVETMHNGQLMRLSKAYIRQFREIGFETPEYDNETGDAEF